MTHSTGSSSSDVVNIPVSRATKEKLEKLRKGDMTYDDVISSMVATENWNVQKIVEHCNAIDKRTKYHSFDEVFQDV